ncbi:MAG TPA: DNA mismatch repair protein MutL, partial [Clostridiaceae bacterium]|nr:DNA mismatch repair protein MutL [Clostridiaceae bacterium]
GDKDTAIFNSKAISSLHLNVPVIFAGNIQCADEVKHILKEDGIKVYVTENVYPRIDELNVEPARKIIQKVFEENITKAPGMSSVRSIVNQNIIPTPGAVMESAMILYGEIGDVIVIDVGGATTDVHSVTEGSEEIQRISISPEPTAKRTVEGDLGVYVNLENIVEKIGMGKVLKDFTDAEELIENKKAIPKTKREMEFIEYLTEEAVKTAVRRHAGTLKYIYGPTGKKTVAEGKDLTNIKWIVGTGGALTRLNKRIEILSKIPKDNAGGKCLYPKENVKVLIDEDYIMASIGALSKKHMEESKIILMHSLGLI